MSVRLRKHLSYANVCATLALALSVGGVSWAAGRLPADSVGSRQLRNNSVASAHIRAETVASGDIRDATIATKDLRGSAVTSGKVADDGLTGADIRDLTGDDINESTLQGIRAEGFERFPTQRVAATSALLMADARDAAPEVRLTGTGVISLTARCYRDTTAQVVYAAVYARTTQDGAVLESDDADFPGGTNDARYLKTGTAAASRQLAPPLEVADNDARWGLSDALTPVPSDAAVKMMGPDGSVLRGFVTMGARNVVTLPYGGVFGDAERGCVFSGFVARS